MYPEEKSSAELFVWRARRHLRWIRTEGLARLIEEDQLRPIARVAAEARRRRWRRANGMPAGTATPVYVVGLQRSGTNMVVRGLETSPEFEVHNENDRRAFDRFQLRPMPDIRALVGASRHRFVLLKPLCDSHRVDELLDGLGAGSPGRALWVYRSVDSRARSATAKFGDGNLQILREIAAGRNLHRWQAQRLSAESLELIRGFDLDRMDGLSAAALFWYVRNALYFERRLHAREDVMPVSYDRMVTAPQDVMRSICTFLDFPYDPRLVAHIGARTPANRGPLELDPVVRRLCTEMLERLDAAVEKKGLRGPSSARRAAEWR